MQDRAASKVDRRYKFLHVKTDFLNLTVHCVVLFGNKKKKKTSRHTSSTFPDSKFTVNLKREPIVVSSLNHTHPTPTPFLVPPFFFISVSFHLHFYWNIHWGNCPQLSYSIDSIYKDLLEHIIKTVKTITINRLFAQHLFFLTAAI